MYTLVCPYRLCPEVIEQHSRCAKLSPAICVVDEPCCKLRHGVDLEEALECVARHSNQLANSECMLVKDVMADIGVEEDGEDKNVLVSSLPPALKAPEHLVSDLLLDVRARVHLVEVSKRNEDMIEPGVQALGNVGCHSEWL